MCALNVLRILKKRKIHKLSVTRIGGTFLWISITVSIKKKKKNNPIYFKIQVQGM